MYSYLLTWPINIFTDCVETYKFVRNQYKTPASMYFKQPARELRGHSQKLNETVQPHRHQEKLLLKPSGRHMEQPTSHNCKGPIYGFNEAEIES